MTTQIKSTFSEDESITITPDTGHVDVSIVYDGHVAAFSFFTPDEARRIAAALLVAAEAADAYAAAHALKNTEVAS